MPDSLERLEDGVFFNCFSLAEINGIENLERIWDGAFDNRRIKGSIKLNKHLKCLGEYAFANTYIESVDFNHCGLEVIEDSAFQNCVRLREVRGLDSRLRLIRTSAFSGCSELESIEGADGEIEIEIYTFEDCDRLRTANLKIIQKSR